MGEFQNLRLRLQDEYRCALNLCHCLQCQAISRGGEEQEQSLLGCPLGLLQTPLLDQKCSSIRYFNGAGVCQHPSLA